jgi:hypothetical protein
VDSKRAAIIIKCICILYNLIRTKNGDSDLDYFDVTQNLNQDILQNEIPNRNIEGRNPNSSQRAKDVRNKFASYFLEH